MSKLRDAARDQDCMVRIPGICNFKSDTTVLAHYRMAGVCGAGMKPIDLIGAWACSDCHNAIDDGKTAYTREQLDLMHLEGMVRTIDALNRRGLPQRREKTVSNRFKVTYTYDNPGPGGPFRGSREVDEAYKRGDFIRGVFGSATVKSCRAIADSHSAKVNGNG